MFRLFKSLKRNMVSAELPVHNYSDINNCTYGTPTQPINYPDGKTARLMELIGYAIDEWAREYHLDNVPKKIIFEQALDAMHAIDLAVNSKR